MTTTVLRLCAALAAVTWAMDGAAWAQSAQTDWIEGNNSRIRLIAAAVQPPDGSGRLTAGVQIELAPGWKTYWRSPGDAGGVPPEFTWTASKNVGPVEVSFPAPSRLRDATGEAIGYKHGVVFPVSIVPLNPTLPVQLDLAIMYGVCKNICIPEERHLTLTLDPKSATDSSIADVLVKALGSVPADPGWDPKSPKITSLKVETAGALSLAVEAGFPAGNEGADLFVEAVDGSYVPAAQRLADSGDGGVRFRIDLSKSNDMKTPSGKQLRLTLVGAAGASQTVRAVP
jgi:DsbC/DsbD-like thiol-disulfide interchange protein